MSKWLKLTIALVVAISVVTVANALANTIYLPMISKYPTATPTMTLTPTVTPTPTRTPTPTPTATPEPGVYILDIEYKPSVALNEYVEIKNTSSKDVDMKDWIIKPDRASSGVKYVFPSFTLKAGKIVNVWTKTGTNTSTDLYWGLSDPIWHDNYECAYLRDSDNDLKDVYCYP